MSKIHEDHECKFKVLWKKRYIMWDMTRITYLVT